MVGENKKTKCFKTLYLKILNCIKRSKILNIKDLIANCQKDWQAYTSHSFVEQIANGTLSIDSFKHYLLQDFLFLKHYTRAFGLAIYKADNIQDMLYALENAKAILEIEINNHIDFCKTFSLSLQDMENIKEDYGTIAYTRYVLDIGLSYGLKELYIALAPCTIGYAQIGLKLKEKNKVLENNPYRKWIELYSSDDFQQLAKESENYINKTISHIENDSKDAKKLKNIFQNATCMEVAFWQQSINILKS